MAVWENPEPLAEVLDEVTLEELPSSFPVLDTGA
jgi:hypothetical protein